MIGQESKAAKLPPLATAIERESWMCEVDLMNISANSEPVSTSTGKITEPSDPHFPYPNGPGHKDSTPQQLSVIWNMMQAVGVSSFCPNFSESATSEDNWWLWELAMRIFIKLVECGEYTGVSLQENNQSSIKKSFHTHIRSLTKRYIISCWIHPAGKPNADQTMN